MVLDESLQASWNCDDMGNFAHQMHIGENAPKIERCSAEISSKSGARDDGERREDGSWASYPKDSAPVAKMDKATGFYPVDCRFESCRGRNVDLRAVYTREAGGLRRVQREARPSNGARASADSGACHKNP